MVIQQDNGSSLDLHVIIVRLLQDSEGVLKILGPFWLWQIGAAWEIGHKAEQI